MNTQLETLLRKAKKNLVAIAACAALTHPALADDIYKGVRGPTNLQLDDRISYNTNEKGVKALSNNLTLKYWDGDTAGKWFFVNAPYRYIHSSENTASGLGDLTLGGGPRGKMGNLHFLSYGALITPTGNDQSKPVLGTGRLDKKLGAFTTYLTPDKKFEMDGSIEYNFTGKDRQGKDVPNELAFGFVMGGKVTNTLRLAIGLTEFIKDSDYLTNLRIVARYTISPHLHFEAFEDASLTSHNLPKIKSATALVRYNF